MIELNIIVIDSNGKIKNMYISNTPSWYDVKNAYSVLQICMQRNFLSRFSLLDDIYSNTVNYAFLCSFFSK